jgi:hypothetical protein
VLHSFDANDDGYYPIAGLIFDKAGNLYGTTVGGDGVAFQLTPSVDGVWNENVVYRFCSAYFCADGGYPTGLIFDEDGNLYGTASGGGINTLCG